MASGSGPGAWHRRLLSQSLRNGMVGALGAIIGIGLTGFVCHFLSAMAAFPFLVAPLGASAVLVFAVPASPLAQPWPVIGGNALSALTGVLVARQIVDPVIAAGVATGAAIAVMTVCRCLHPPGGAAALTAVVGGPAIAALGFTYPLAPVALNSLLLVACGIAFHRVVGHAYPHRILTTKTELASDELRKEDIEHALADLEDTIDVAPDDLAAILRRAESYARNGRGERF